MKAGCESFLTAKPGQSQITVRFGDGGEFLATGRERWTVSSTVPLSCLGIESVNRCVDATFYPEMTLFNGTAGGGCTANACGVCDCPSELEGYVGSFGYSWSRSGNQLKLGTVTVDYCVQGDVMWLGGKRDGLPKAAYKLSKHSCEGTPVPCSQRTPEQCSMGSCSMGQCKGKNASQLGCESSGQNDCEVTVGCVWDPTGCYGDPIQSGCTTDTCDYELGCSWGPPKQRCAGEAQPCCTAIVADGDCALLDSASCRKATGCQVTSTGCIGSASCPRQTDAAICTALGCDFRSGCTPTDCAALSVDACHTAPGCHVDW
jgi:hypothetical protein